MLNTNEIRKDFPFLQDKDNLGRIYFDNGASTQAPIQVINSFVGALNSYANIHRGAYPASITSSENFEKYPNAAANLVNANSWREIIPTRNTTEGANIIAYGIMQQLKSGDNIVVSRLEHNSGYVPFKGIQDRLRAFNMDIDVRLVDFNTADGELDYSSLEKAVDNKTKLVSISGASNYLGTKPNIKKVVDIAHSTKYSHPNGDMGAYVYIDGAQLVPGTPVDVQDLGIDFLTWSGHKMLIPFGVGALWSREKILESFEPFLYGGDMVQFVSDQKIMYNELPWRFVAGTPNIPGTIAAVEGINYLVNAGLTGDYPKDIVDKDMTRFLLNTPRGDFIVPTEIPKGIESLPVVQEYLNNNALRQKAANELVKKAMSHVQKHEQELTQKAIDGLKSIEGLTMYGTLDATKRTGLISFSFDGYSVRTLESIIPKYGLDVRCGFHCAHLVAQNIGKQIPNGVDTSLKLTGGAMPLAPLIPNARMSFYIYNTPQEIDQAVDIMRHIKKTHVDC